MKNVTQAHRVLDLRTKLPRKNAAHTHNGVEPSGQGDSRSTEKRQGALAGAAPRVNWISIDNYVVSTVLGMHYSTAIALDNASKRTLDIPVDHLVLLPGEERRIRMDQVKDYCDRVLKGGERVSGFEVAYLMEMLGLTRDEVASCVGLATATFDALVDEDDAFSANDSARLGLYFLHAWSVNTGRIRYSS